MMNSYGIISRVWGSYSSKPSKRKKNDVQIKCLRGEQQAFNQLEATEDGGWFRSVPMSGVKWRFPANP